MTDFMNVIKELSKIDSPACYEQAFAAKITELVTAENVSFRQDKIGNLIFSRQPHKGTLFAAHMDEPCIIATSFTDSGRIKFDRVGSIPPAALFGKRVRFEKTLGVIECVPPHLLSGDDLSKIPDTKDMCIDIGAKDKKEATDHISYGDMGVFDGDFKEFGDGFFCGKGLGRLFSCAALICILNDTDICGDFLFAVKNEASFVGAKTAAFSGNYQKAVVLDAAESFDFGGSSEKAGCSVGKGAVIAFKNGSVIFDEGLCKNAFSAAEQKGICIQPLENRQTPNCAGVIQTAGSGVKVMSIFLAVRNLCSGREAACKKDVTECIRLLTALGEQDI